MDDDPELRAMVRGLLGERNVLLEAETGEEGLRIARTSELDLILLDWNLPGIDGFAVLQELQASTRLRRTPVIIVSARTATDDSVAALEAGAFDFVRKPFEPRELVARVAGVLRRCGQRAPTVLQGGSLPEAQGGQLPGLQESTGDTLSFARPEGSELIVSPAEQTDALLGTVYANRYRILELLGTGGSSLVFRVEHMLLGSQLALKILRADRETDAQRERFLREARVISQLRHPGIVPLREFGALPTGELYLAMELCDGPSLRDQLRASGPFEPARAVDIMCQILEALSEAHALGVFHRDLKPENIVFTDPDLRRVAILDFGLATRGEVPVGPSLTLAGTMIGTPLYMSPEQVLGSPVGAASDTFSLGVVLYELLTGSLPHNGESIQEVVRAILVEPTLLPDTVPPALRAILQRALEKKPEDRFASTESMREALQEAVSACWRGYDTCTRSRMSKRPLLEVLRSVESASSREAFLSANPWPALVFGTFHSAQDSEFFTLEGDGEGGGLSVLDVRKRPGANAFSEMITIGRAANNDVKVRERSVSKFHAYIKLEEGRRVLIDAGSSYGTRVNGTLRARDERTLLESGDLLQLGHLQLTYYEPAELYDMLKRALAAPGEVA